MTSEMLEYRLETIQKEYKTMSTMRKPKPPGNDTKKETNKKGKSQDKKIDEVDYAKIQDMLKGKDDDNKKMEEMIV